MKEKIPEDWLEITYNDIGKFYGGGTPSTSSQEYWNGSIAWTTSKALGDSLYMNVGERTISARGLKESSTTLIPKGNLLIGTRVGVGKVVVNKVDIAISQDLTGVVVNQKKCLPEFIAYQTREQRLQECFRKQKRGVTIQGVSRDDLKEFILYLPPLPEQQKITAILFKIQQAIEVQESIIERLQELKKSTMQHVFTYGLRGEKTKETEIGKIPESWKIIHLEKVCKIERGKFTHRPRNDPAYYGGTIPFIQTGDVANSNGRIKKYSQTLNELGLSVSKIFSAGTILITIAANIGDTGILEFDSAFPDSIIGLTPNEGINGYYLEYYLRTQKQKMMQLAPKGTQMNINIQFLKPWPLLLPSKNEQDEIAKTFQIIDEKIDFHTAKKSALQNLFKTMLNKLMSGEIRVRNLEVDIMEMQY